MEENDPSFDDPNNQIGLCGVFCKGCPAYLTRCYGCRSQNRGSIQKRKSKWNCKKRLCVLEKGYNHCGECSFLPCTIRKYLDRTYKENYDIDLIENCKNIDLNGPQKWIHSQIQKYTCKRCGELYSPYEKHCRICN